MPILFVISTWLSSTCETYLISNTSPPTEQTQTWLRQRYVYFGSRAYFGDRKAARELHYIGEELREYNIGKEELDRYSSFER